MTKTPWYMRTVEPVTETNNPDTRRRHLESLAETASAETDAMVAHLKAAEARGVEIDPSTRMAMGYATVARKAAALLSDSEKRKAGTTEGDMTPEQRIARGYGSAN